MDLCAQACSALGEGLALWLFSGAAFAFGWWQKHRRAVAVKEVAEARQEVQELRSLRPLPLPPLPISVVHYTAPPSSQPPEAETSPTIPYRK